MLLLVNWEKRKNKIKTGKPLLRIKSANSQFIALSSYSKPIW